MNRTKQRPFFLVVMISVALVFTACTPEMQAASPEVEVVVPTVIIQQYVTQVVATALPPESTAVPAAPATQAANPVSVGWDPLSAPIYYPIIGCVASRLYVGDRAFVAYGADNNSIYQSQEIGDAPIFRHLYPGEIMEIIDGPFCERGAVVWQVFALIDEQVGFVAEGNGEVYWLLPLPPGGESLYEAYHKATTQEEILKQLFGGRTPIFRPAGGTCRSSEDRK
ncbi:MAG: hypothetical protein JXA78_08790 [Anaerolineales bacterium]|nr:hypothetical protein [Anaerolineales bacterium]